MKLSGIKPRHRRERPTTNGINPTQGTAPKRYAARFYQLKVGNGAVGTFLARIWVIDTPPNAGGVWRQSSLSKTFTLNVGDGERERRKMVRELYIDRRCKMLRNEGGWQGY